MHVASETVLHWFQWDLHGLHSELSLSSTASKTYCPSIDHFVAAFPPGVVLLKLKLDLVPHTIKPFHLPIVPPFCLSYKLRKLRSLAN